jgi:hypothetical protein
MQDGLAERSQPVWASFHGLDSSDIISSVQCQTCGNVHQPLLRTSRKAFVGELKIIHSPIAENCRRLDKVHAECQDWARRHGAKFAPEKYELIHLKLYRSRGTDLHETIRISRTACPPKTEQLGTGGASDCHGVPTSAVSRKRPQAR